MIIINFIAIDVHCIVPMMMMSFTSSLNSGLEDDASSIAHFTTVLLLALVVGTVMWEYAIPFNITGDDVLIPFIVKLYK